MAIALAGVDERVARAAAPVPSLCVRWFIERIPTFAAARALDPPSFARAVLARDQAQATVGATDEIDGKVVSKEMLGRCGHEGFDGETRALLDDVGVEFGPAVNGSKHHALNRDTTKLESAART